MSELLFDVVGAQAPRLFFGRLTKETIAHGYLFTGPDGVGKKTFARRFAQSLLCEARKSGVMGYDGTCASCRLFDKEKTHHPDFLQSTGALKIGNTDSELGFHEGDEITSRDLVRQLSLQSYSGGFRIFLLGDVDFASPPAANALLKFFEEPPPSVVLLLTTSMPGRLLATIRSRLIEIRFAALRRPEVEQVLQRLGYEAERAKVGAALGQGSVSRAIAALSEDENVRSSAARWFFAVVAGSSPEESWATRETLDEGLETVGTLVRDWIALGVGGANAPLVAVDYADRLKRLPALAAPTAVTVLGKLRDAGRLARTNVTPSAVSEFVRMNLSATAGGSLPKTS